MLPRRGSSFRGPHIDQDFLSYLKYRQQEKRRKLRKRANFRVATAVGTTSRSRDGPLEIDIRDIWWETHNCTESLISPPSRHMFGQLYNVLGLVFCIT